MRHQVQFFLACLVLLLFASCVTPALWERTLAIKGDNVCRAKFSVASIWNAGEGRLGMETGLAGADTHLVLISDGLSDPHPRSVIASAEPSGCTLTLHLEQKDDVAGSASLQIEGLITAGLRQVPEPPTRAFRLENPPSVQTCCYLLSLLCEDIEPAYLEITPTCWLLDGRPAEDGRFIAAAMGSDGGAPDFAFLRRIELLLKASDAAAAQSFAIRGDALWMAENATCQRYQDGLHWEHCSRALVAQAEVKGPLLQRRQTAIAWQGEAAWHEERDMIFPTVMAVLATPVTIAVDCALVVGTGGLILGYVYVAAHSRP